ncbi:sodium:proton antiporter [Lactobacillaceae bacterium 24-114]
MALIISLIIIFVAAVISSIISAMIPKLSINYVSIIIGIIIVLIAPLNRLVTPFEPDVFMYIVAPLIYFEGQTTRINLVRNSLWQIINLCIVLVLVLMVISGVVVSLFGIPLALAFLIGALSTPTDATATETVSEGLIVPKDQEVPLKMESLFNDATAIILVGATSLWVERGNFNYQSTMQGFLFSAIGGIVTGITIALVMINFRRSLEQHNFDAHNAQNMLFIITPFFIYFIAEEIKVSGIIAVVCAGLMQNSESINSRFVYPRQFHNGIMLLDLFRELLNNMVFIILGLSFVRIVRDDIINEDAGWEWLVIGLIIYLVNLIIRFAYGKLSRMSTRGSFIFAIGGVRGAVTLALVFMVTDRLTNGQFQEVVLIETFMIVLSMIVPSIVLPFILPHQMAEKEVKARVNSLKNEMVDEGLKAVQDIYLPARVKERVLFDLRDQRSANSTREFWRQWLRSNQHPSFNSEERELEQRALLWAFRAEREYLDMVSQKENMEKYVYQLYNDVLLSESIIIDPENNLG